MSARFYKQCIDRMRPYVPGKPIEEVERELGISNIIKLASNENPVGPSPKAVEAMSAACKSVALYPDGSCFALRQAVSEHLGVEPECLSFGTGSDELIREIGNVFLVQGDTVVQVDPSFSQYEGAATANDCECIMVPLTPEFEFDVDAVIDCIDQRTKLVFLPNPNNPTGTILTHSQMERILFAMPEHAILVLDEAYYEYVECDEYPNGLQWIKEGKNVILLRTFSKIYGLAGLRLGYAVARPELIELIERIRLPFNVSSVVQAAAIAALADQEHVASVRRINVEGRDSLYKALDQMNLPYTPSEANFVWIDTKTNCKQVFQEMLKRGVIIRTGDIFGCPTHIRITIGTSSENDRCIAALGEALANAKREEGLS